jgi:glutaredoxin
MSAPKIVAYLNPMCPWTRSVVQVLDKHKLEYDYRNVTGEPGALREMVEKTGQHGSPCVEINGHMLVDVGGDEVEAYLQQQAILVSA